MLRCAQHFTTSGGVAMASFCACVDAMVANATQLSAMPELSPYLSEKQLSAAMCSAAAEIQLGTGPCRSHGPLPALR